MRGGKKKNRRTEKRITKASIDSGRRSNDLRQTARELKGQGRGRRFPRVKSTYRLRSRRSSEFPVINYGVDDRVPPLFLLLLLLPPPPRPFFFFLFFSFYLAPGSYPFAHPFPSMSGSSPFSPPALETLAPFSLFFLYSPNCLAEAVCCVSGQRSNHVWSPFIKLSIPDTCTARARDDGTLDGTSEHAWPRLFRQPILNSDPKPESDLKERC